MYQPHQITAKCHQKTGNRCYRVKVSFLDMPMYINGFQVFSPNEQFPEWYVKGPTFRTLDGKKKPIIEFAKNGENPESELWNALSKACIEAAMQYDKFRKDLEDIRPMYS